MKKQISKWILYNILVCFTVYWLSNVILWYPWSMNERLGQILMLTINPILWGYASYNCIITFPKENILRGILLNSLIFEIVAIGSDLLFFAAIRNAMDKLMQPTTIYGWMFVFFFPFVFYLLFGKRILKNKKKLEKTDFLIPLYIGVICFAIIVIILVFNIKFY